MSDPVQAVADWLMRDYESQYAIDPAATWRDWEPAAKGLLEVTGLATAVAERDNYQRSTTNLSIGNAMLRRALSTLIREAEAAISRIPGECRYHGKSLAARPNMAGQTACCDTGAPSLAKRGCATAIKSARAALDGGS